MTDRSIDPVEAEPDVPEAIDDEFAARDAIDDELAVRDAGAFVHVGSARDPAVRYCLFDLDRSSLRASSDAESRTHAVARDGERWVHRVADSGEPSPATSLATDLRGAGLEGPILTPADVPHDAALYLEEAGCLLASSDVLARARAEKSVAERGRIERTAAAAASGLEAAATVLHAATVGDDDRLAFEGDPLAPDDLRIAADRAIVDAGALPAGNTRVTGGDATDAGTDVDAESLAAGEPIVLAFAPRGPEGYHAALVRTLVVAGEGGDERRAHVALTGAFRSAEALLSTDRSIAVADVERDLEAEIRAFGFEGGIETRVAGIGLESRERPLRPGEEIGPDAIVRVEAGVEVDGGAVRLADAFAPGEGWLAAPSRSLDPAAILE